jgi:hypothetical protein
MAAFECNISLFYLSFRDPLVVSSAAFLPALRLLPCLSRLVCRAARFVYAALQDVSCVTLFASMNVRASNFEDPLRCRRSRQTTGGALKART